MSKADADVKSPPMSDVKASPVDLERAISKSDTRSSRLRSIPIKSKWWSYWVATVFAIQTCTLIVVPIIVAWTEHFLSPYNVIVWVMFDIFLGFHMFLSSIVVKKNKYGISITDPIALQKLYLTSKYNILLVATVIPWDLLAFIPVDTPLLKLSFQPDHQTVQ